MTFDLTLNIDSEVETDAEATEEDILAEITPAATTEAEEASETSLPRAKYGWGYWDYFGVVNI